MPDKILEYYSLPFEVMSYILEDDDEDASEVERLFKENKDLGNYRRFSKGSDLVKVLPERRVDIFIADFKGIDLDGLAAMMEVKKFYKRCYFILITQYVTNEIIDKAVNEIGIRHYINKNDRDCFTKLLNFIRDGEHYVRQDFEFLSRIKARIEYSKNIQSEQK
jgi:response regulator RpfG family c-di-GMP phosphodiesterase